MLTRMIRSVLFLVCAFAAVGCSAPGESASPAVREYATEVCEQMERVGEVLASVLPEWESSLGEYPAPYTPDEAIEVGESAFETLFIMPRTREVHGFEELDNLRELHSLTMGVASYVADLAVVLSGRYSRGPGVAPEFLVQENERIVSELDPALADQLNALCPAALLPAALLDAEPLLPESPAGPAQEPRDG